MDEEDCGDRIKIIIMASERSSMLRRQRESALRKRQSHAPISRNNSTGSEASYRDALADVNAFEEARTREKIEIRMREEEEMKMQLEEEARVAEIQRYEQEQGELKRRLAEEQKEARRLAEAAEAEAELRRYEQEQKDLLKRRLEEEQETARRLEEAKADAERMEKKRFQYELERERLAVIERGKIEAEHSRMIELQSLARQVGAPIEEDNIGESNENISHDNTAGGNNGYQRYLSTYHLSEAAEDPGVEKTQNTDSCRGSKIKRTTSSRSLSFDEVNGENPPTKSVSGEEKESCNEEVQVPKHTGGNKISSLKQATSIVNVNLDDPEATRSFLMKPCPKEEDTIECCIRRNKGIKNALFPEYRMYLKSNNSKTETFLMTSKKRAGSKTSNYLISMSRNDHDKNSDSVLGKLRSNFLGTEYSIFDSGKNPAYDESFYDEKNDGDTRLELGAILYATNTTLGAKGPRKMKVCISKEDDDGNPLVWQPTNKEDERMVTCFKKETSNIDKLLCLENTPPKWNEEVGAYVLNFHGRVTQSSVKNFQLCDHSDEQKQIMQFGRTGKDEFSLDVQWPMSPFQAFAVALSSFDSKLGCD